MAETLAGESDAPEQYRSRVLTLRKIPGGRAGVYAAYLTSIEATGDYYVGPDGDPWAAPGQWLGGLAAELDLRGALERTDLLAVLEGRDPHTGERAVGRWREDRVAAHDLVFSAPSSVTAVWALAGDELRAAVQQAQDQAVAEAFAYIEREFALVRRRDPEQRATALEALRQKLGRELTRSERRAVVAPIISEPAAALLGAAFSHHTSRQTAQQARAGWPRIPSFIPMCSCRGWPGGGTVSWWPSTRSSSTGVPLRPGPCTAPPWPPALASWASPSSGRPAEPKIRRLERAATTRVPGPDGYAPRARERQRCGLDIP